MTHTHTHTHTHTLNLISHTRTQSVSISHTHTLSVLQVPSKFRYPFFTEMLWYVLERYVHVLLGRTHLTLPPDEQEKYTKYASTRLKANNNNKMNEDEGDEEVSGVDGEDKERNG